MNMKFISYFLAVVVVVTTILATAFTNASYSAPAGSIFIGTFRDHPYRALNYGPKKYGYNVTSCQAACSSYSYFALQNGSWCSCSDDIVEATQYGVFNKAEDSAHPLGGPWKNAIYAKVSSGQKSVIAGIFIDTLDRALRYGPKQYGYTVATCHTTCKSQGYGLSAIENNGWCTCDSSLSHAQKWGVAPKDGIGHNAIANNGNWAVMIVSMDTSYINPESPSSSGGGGGGGGGESGSQTQNKPCSSSSSAEAAALSTEITVVISVLGTIVGMIILQTIIYFTCVRQNIDQNQNQNQNQTQTTRNNNNTNINHTRFDRNRDHYPAINNNDNHDPVMIALGKPMPDNNFAQPMAHRYL